MSSAIQLLSETVKSSNILTFISKSLERKNAPLSAITLFVLYYLIKYRDNSVGTRRTNIPGPKGLPLIGNLLWMLSIPMEKISQMHDENHEKYGSTWTFTMPSLGRTIMVNDPVVLEHVLKTNFWAYEKGDKLIDSMADMLGNGIFNADGEQWRWQRKMASHIFNVKAFRDYTNNVFVQESNIVANYLDTIAKSGSTVDIQEIFLKFTLDSFGEVSFSKSFGCLDNPEQDVEFAQAFDRLNGIISERLFLGPWKFIEWLTGVNKQVAKDKKIVTDFALDIIRHRREHGFHKSQKDLLQLFMDLKGEDGQYLSDEVLKDSILNFIIAGRDTTAQALSWMFYLMHRSSTDKSIAKKLREEIQDVLGDDGIPTYESSKKMKYAEACLYEGTFDDISINGQDLSARELSILTLVTNDFTLALRLYPSVPRNFKVCVQDDVLPNGYEIKKGENFIWSPWTMGRDTNIWGPDAKEYKPERWITDDKFSATKFPAFHAGPRTCLGQQFATIEAITIMSIIFRKFNFELVDPDHEPAYAKGLTLPIAAGLPIHVHRRDQTSTVAV